MRLHELYTNTRTPIMEGGNVFDGTAPFDHELVPTIMKPVNAVLGKTGTKGLPIGSGANPTPGKQMGDLDVIVDAQTLIDFFGVKDVKNAKIELEKLYQKAGYETAKSGQSVHVKIPVDGTAAQVDIMVVPNAEPVSKFHFHNIPQGSQYKGKHKQIAMSKLAREAGYKWSGFKGLIDVTNDPKGEDPITDLDQIAEIILGNGSKASDLGSMESILSAVGPERAQNLMTDLEQDAQFNK